MKNADMPAMPQSFSIGDEDCGTTLTHLHVDDIPENMGLTKREMIAMHAMQGLMTSVEHYDLACPQETARAAVAHADALLKELEK